MKLLLTMVSLAVARTWARPSGALETPNPNPIPWGGIINDDQIALAKIYPIMPGFDIFTFPYSDSDPEAPPTEEQIKKIQSNLQTRFRHKSRDANHSLYDEDQGFCNMVLSSHHGSHCWIEGTPDVAISGNSTNLMWGRVPKFDYPEHGCAWTDLEHRPPTAVFEDGGFGRYGVRWTATHGNYSKTYQGKNLDGGGYACNYDGLCFPQLVFYRRGYRLVISTWKIPVARLEYCEWDGGWENPEPVTRYELCVDRTDSRFGVGGAHFKYVCAVPCWNDGNIDVEQPHSPGEWNEFERDPEWNETAANWNWTRGVDTCS